MIQTRPIISVDWSDLDARGQHFLIRAGMAFEGRSITLYEEVHDKLTKEKPKTYRQFLSALKALLPSKAKPIIVTDAGFKTPWLDEVMKQGWDYVGRVRRPRKYYDDLLQAWRCISTLFSRANQKPKHLELKHRQSSPITNHQSPITNHQSPISLSFTRAHRKGVTLSIKKVKGALLYLRLPQPEGQKNLGY